MLPLTREQLTLKPFDSVSMTYRFKAALAD